MEQALGEIGYRGVTVLNGISCGSIIQVKDQVKIKLVKTGENNWSLPELVHAVVLLAHYHALASFVFGSGINPERDPEISNGFKLISVNNFGVCDLANDNNIENASLAGTNFGV
ncbi:Sestrin-3 [Manis javanica]|nr:Sestrin-3 [Manis javanica]